MENIFHTSRKLLRRRPNLTSAPGRWGALWRTGALAGAACLIVWTCVSPKLLHAQAQAQTQTAQPAKPAAHAAATHAAAAHRRATVHRAALHTAKPAAGVAAAPAAPPKPNWPAEQPPNPARITWDSQGLAIQASNSSLEQIMRDVATDTGAKLEGLDKDERIFGTYGPGPAREVLSRLLDGSGYNVLMIGGQGDEPPQQILLSKSAAGPQQPARAQNSSNDEDADGDEQSPQPDNPQPLPLRSPFGAAEMPNRTPQEIQQEMQMRAQQNEQPRPPEQNNPQF